MRAPADQQGIAEHQQRVSGRIAQGAGVQVQEVNRMLKEFEQMQDTMKKMKGGGMMKMMKHIGGMGGMKGMPKFWAYHHGLWQATGLNQRSDRGNTSRSP